MTDRTVVLAQIGCGYWGPNLLRNFSAAKNCLVKYVVELSEERRQFVESNFPKTKAVSELELVMDDSEVEAVVIATPAATHYHLAMDALAKWKHVFVEKPLAMSTREADDLAVLAKQKGRVLMVGHTFLYNPAVEYLRQLVVRGDLGSVRYAYAQRLNLGVIRSDVNVMWNLAPHDISILCYVLGAPPLAVSAVGTDYIQENIEDVVFMNLEFPERIRANIHVSWLDPNKVRRITVVGVKKMVVYDDVADDKITIYDKGIDKQKSMPFDDPALGKLIHRSGDILIPKIDFKEPLKIEAIHFIDCVLTKKTPLTDVASGRNVIDVLVAAQQSLKSNGQIIRLGQDASSCAAR